jgi:hypothetical protein
LQGSLSGLQVFDFQVLDLDIRLPMHHPSRRQQKQQALPVACKQQFSILQQKQGICDAALCCGL